MTKVVVDAVDRRAGHPALLASTTRIAGGEISRDRDRAAGVCYRDGTDGAMQVITYIQGMYSV